MDFNKINTTSVSCPLCKQLFANDNALKDADDESPQ